MRSQMTLMMTTVLFSAAIVVAHEGHHHGAEKSQDEKNAELSLAALSASAVVASDYVENIKPIFAEKCAACHSLEFTQPWYASIPGVRSLIEQDQTEARHHLEISKGFPFAGHGDPREDLEAIKQSTIKSSMPTPLYVFFHPEQRLYAVERAKIIAWVDRSLERLSKAGVEKSEK